MENKTNKQILKIVERLITKEIKLTNKILEENKVYPLSEIVFIRDNIVCISTKVFCCWNIGCSSYN